MGATLECALRMDDAIAILRLCGDTVTFGKHRVNYIDIVQQAIRSEYYSTPARSVLDGTAEREADENSG